MKDEIKEILDRLERIDHKEYSCAFEFADSATFDEMARCFEERKKMADYITNLQEENERLKNGYCELKVKCNNGECDCTNEEYDGMVQANMKGKLLLEDYKSRNEKAIEYIQNSLILTDDFNIYEDGAKELLNILQGSDKDEF